MTPDIDSAVAQLEAAAWALHKRLGEKYPGGKADQWRDMAKLGLMGRRLLKLAEARYIVRELDREREKEKAEKPGPFEGNPRRGPMP